MIQFYPAFAISCALLPIFQNDRPAPRRPTITAQTRRPLRKERWQSLLVVLSGHKARILAKTTLAMSSSRMLAAMSSIVISVLEMEPIVFFRDKSFLTNCRYETVCPSCRAHASGCLAAAEKTAALSKTACLACGRFHPMGPDPEGGSSLAPRHWTEATCNSLGT